MKQSHFIPQVNKVLRHPVLQARQAQVSREVLAKLTRLVLNTYRLQNDSDSVHPGIDQIAARVDRKADRLLRGGLGKVINGTGVILNTNLGRLPMPQSVVRKLMEVLPHYSCLEIDLDSGKRGQRTSFIEELLSLIIDCESPLL